MASSKNIRSILKGVIDPKYDGKVTQYRGIQFATIKKRFAKPILNTKWQQKTDCTKYGPRCPQVSRDFGEFMHIPRELKSWPVEEEDELKCDNLTVSCPSDPSSTKLPVLIWIHGGSQMQSFGNSSQLLGNTNPLVAQSIELGKPVVFVAIHYRLNIFAFGDREGELNLELQDQRIAIEWVKKNISLFGGDPDNITLAGQSAGAIYIHALLASGTDVSRVIMNSGSLYATPPQPDKRSLGLIGLLEGNLQLIEFERGNMNPGETEASTISGAPAAHLVQSLKDLEITSKWMWEEPSLRNFQQVDKVFGNLKGMIIGDCQVEGMIYSNFIDNLGGKTILKVFEAASGGAGKKLAEAYGISASDDAASRKAAIEFIGDARFNWPTFDIAQRMRQSGHKAYRYIFDQPNPFAKQDAIVHHGVDLLAVFAGYEDIEGAQMRTIGRQLRSDWIRFVYGEEPWNVDKVYAYGPNGKIGEINSEEAASRRREKQFGVLKDVGLKTYQEIWWALIAAGATEQAAK